MVTNVSNRPVNQNINDNQDEMKDYTSFWAFIAVIVVAVLVYASYSSYYGREPREYPSAPISQTMGSLDKSKLPEPAIVNP